MKRAYCIRIFRVYKLLGLLLFLSACQTNPRPILDDEAFIEETIQNVLAGEQFRIKLEDFPYIKELLSDDNPEYRLAGVRLAIQSGDEIFNGNLVSMALDEEPRVAKEATAFIEAKPERFRESINELIRSSVAANRVSAITIIGASRFPDALEILIRYFGDENELVRDKASSEFFKLADRNNILLRDALNSPYPLTASSAYQTLGKYKAPADLPLFISAVNSDIAEVRRVAKRVAFRFGEQALPLLHRQAYDSNLKYLLRLRALELIQGIGSSNSLNLLFDLLEDRDELIIQRSESILSGYGIESVPILKEIFRQSSKKVQIRIIDMLSEMRDASVIEILIEGLESQSPLLVDASLAVLQSLQISGIDTYSAVREVLESPDEFTVLKILDFLREKGDPWLVLIDGGEGADSDGDRDGLPNRLAGRRQEKRQEKRLNVMALKLLIVNVDLPNFTEYLNLSGISRSWRESLVSIKKAWDVSEEFVSLEKGIKDNKGGYAYIWRQKEIYDSAARNVLEESFEALHLYHESKDEKMFRKSGVRRRQSRQLSKKSQEMELRLRELSSEEIERGEAQLGMYQSLRNIIIEAWNFSPVELQEFFLELYGMKSLDPEKISRESLSLH